MMNKFFDARFHTLLNFDFSSMFFLFVNTCFEIFFFISYLLDKFNFHELILNIKLIGLR